MKILIMCPGSFTHGLNSPERGESRWAQNYARMLAMADHEVFAASGHIGQLLREENVLLCNETIAHQYGPFDLFIDPAWWNGKEIRAEAKHYIILKWSLEPYTREFNFPDNHWLAYPYPSHMWEFYIPDARGRDRTFALPTMFGTEFPIPNWDKKKIFLPGKIDKARDYRPYLPAIVDFLNQYPVEGCSQSFFQAEFGDQLKLHGDSCLYELKPYNEVIDSMSRCKLSLPILNPGCIIEAAFMGTPSIFWEEGGFYNPLARNLGVLIEKGSPPERFLEIANEMMFNRKRHWEVTKLTQEYFSCHLYDNAIQYFNQMIEMIF